MKNGDVVFFKKAKASSARKAPEVMFKGMGFGVLLGHCPPFAQNPPAAFVVAQLGAVGYLSFDDVAEFLGPEACALAVQKFEAKYIPTIDPNAPHQPELPLDAPAAPAAQAAPEEPEDDLQDRPSGLVGINGKPLQSIPHGGDDEH